MQLGLQPAALLLQRLVGLQDIVCSCGCSFGQFFLTDLDCFVLRTVLVQLPLKRSIHLFQLHNSRLRHIELLLVLACRESAGGALIPLKLQLLPQRLDLELQFGLFSQV